MTAQQEPRVSVVTPVYNGESYLRECIESVLAQTYPHWDYTIVNNCSTDGTLAIALEYARKDPRIRVVNNEKFVRAIANHNIALGQISPESKYCKVVAADDWIFPECLEKMVALAEGNPSVVIVGAYGLFGTTVACAGLPYPSTVVSGPALCRLNLTTGPYVFGAPTNLLFRADIVRNRRPFYNESNLHADTDACYEILEHHDFGFVHQVLTFIRKRDDSLTSFSTDFNTYLPGILYELLNYGPKFLGEGELARWTDEQLRKYYRYLGAQVYRRRGDKFWTFHRDKLAELGYPLSKPRVAVHAMLHALDSVYSKRTFSAALRWLRRALSKLTG